jgi:hypothetical protein
MMNTHILDHEGRPVTLSVRGNELKIMLADREWLARRLADDFVCDSLICIEKQTKASSTALPVVSYALCAIGETDGAPGVVQIFMTMNDKNTPKIYASKFIAREQHEKVGGKRRTEDSDLNEPDHKRTRLGTLSDEEYSDYMEDVEVERAVEDTKVVRITDISSNEWSNVLAYLTREDIIKSVSATSSKFFDVSLNSVTKGSVEHDIIVFAQEGNSTSLQELLRRCTDSNRDIFTYALRQSIELENVECAIELLVDGRADPSYKIVNTEHMARLTEENALAALQVRLPRTLSQEETVLKAARIIEYQIDRYKELDFYPTQHQPVYDTQTPLKAMDGDRALGVLMFADVSKMVALNALVHTSSLGNKNAINRLIKYLIKHYEWDRGIVKLVLLKCMQKLDFALLDMLVEQYTIGNIPWLLKCANDHEPLFQHIFYGLQQGAITPENVSHFLLAIDIFTGKSDIYAEYLIDTKWKSITEPAIQACARSLFWKSLPRCNFPLLNKLKKQGNYVLSASDIGHNLNVMYYTQKISTDALKFILEEYIRDGSDVKNLVSVMYQFNDFVACAADNKLVDFTGEYGMMLYKDALFKASAPELAKYIIQYAHTHACLGAWLRYLLYNLHLVREIRQCERLLGCILAESAYNPLGVIIEFIESVDTASDRELERYKESLYTILSDSRVLAIVAQKDHLFDKAFHILNTIDTPPLDYLSWEYQIEDNYTQTYKSQLIAFLVHLYKQK